MALVEMKRIVPTGVPLTRDGERRRRRRSRPAPCAGSLALAALSMLNLMVQVVARPRPMVRQKSPWSVGVFTQPKRWLSGSLASGFFQASDVACGTCSKNQSLW